MRGKRQLIYLGNGFIVDAPKLDVIANMYGYTFNNKKKEKIMTKFELMERYLKSGYSDEDIAFKIKVKPMILQRMKTIKKLNDEGYSAKEIAKLLGMNYDVLIDFTKTRGFHFKRHQTNCFTCANFYINHKGMPDCNCKCAMGAIQTSNYIPMEDDEIEIESLGDVICRYFGLAFTNDEAIKFYENCKKFYENEILK